MAYKGIQRLAILWSLARGAYGSSPGFGCVRMARRVRPARLAGDCSIEKAPKVDLVVNLKTAKARGLTIPPEVPMRADKVIRRGNLRG